MSTLRTILITTTRQQALRTVLVNRGPSGIGIPTGGTPGQVVGKASEADFDTEWVDPSAGGGASSWAELSGKPLTFAPIIGSGAADAVAGNDARLTNARTPTAHGHAWSDLTSGVPLTFPPIIGSGAADAVAGNDARLTNARTPTAHGHAWSDLTSGVPTTFPPTIGSGAGDAVAGNDPALTNARERVIHQINELDVLTGSGGSGIPVDAGEYVFTMDYPGNGPLWPVKANDAVVGEIIVHNRSAGATLDLYPPGYASAVSASILPGQTGVYVPSETGGAWVAIKAGGVLALVSDITRTAIGATATGSALITAVDAAAARTAIGATATGSALITAATAAAAATAAGVGTGDDAYFKSIKSFSNYYYGAASSTDQYMKMVNGYFFFYGYGKTQLYLTNGGKVSVASGLWFGDPSNASSNLDAGIQKDSAGVLSQKNGAVAQKFRIYGTETGSKYAQLEHDGTNAKLSTTAGVILADNPFGLKSYTAAAAGALTGMVEGSTIYVSNESGGKTLAFFDGTNWKRTSDNAIIS